MTMTLVETITVGAGGAASIEFTSIPQDADDLLLLLSSRATVSNASQMRMQFSGVTTGYDFLYLRGSGTAVLANTTTGTFYGLVGFVSNSTSTANTFTNAAIRIPNYTSSANKYYSAEIISENNAAEAWQTLTAGVMNDTTAISSILLFTNLGDFAQYSTASLYKITKA